MPKRQAINQLTKDGGNVGEEADEEVEEKQSTQEEIKKRRKLKGRRRKGAVAAVASDAVAEKPSPSPFSGKISLTAGGSSGFTFGSSTSSAIGSAFKKEEKPASTNEESKASSLKRASPFPPGGGASFGNNTPAFDFNAVVGSNKSSDTAAPTSSAASFASSVFTGEQPPPKKIELAQASFSFNKPGSTEKTAAGAAKSGVESAVPEKAATKSFSFGGKPLPAFGSSSLSSTAFQFGAPAKKGKGSASATATEPASSDTAEKGAAEKKPLKFNFGAQRTPAGVSAPAVGSPFVFGSSSAKSDKAAAVDQTKPSFQFGSAASGAATTKSPFTFGSASKSSANDVNSAKSSDNKDESTNAADAAGGDDDGDAMAPEEPTVVEAGQLQEGHERKFEVRAKCFEMKEEGWQNRGFVSLQVISRPGGGYCVARIEGVGRVLFTGAIFPASKPSFEKAKNLSVRLVTTPPKPSKFLFRTTTEQEGLQLKAAIEGILSGESNAASKKASVAPVDDAVAKSNDGEANSVPSATATEDSVTDDPAANATAKSETTPVESETVPVGSSPPNVSGFTPQASVSDEKKGGFTPSVPLKFGGFTPRATTTTAGAVKGGFTPTTTTTAGTGGFTPSASAATKGGFIVGSSSTSAATATGFAAPSASSSGGGFKFFGGDKSSTKGAGFTPSSAGSTGASSAGFKPSSTSSSFTSGFTPSAGFKPSADTTSVKTTNAAPSSKQSWKCKSCETENASDVKQCTVCLLIRPDAAPQKSWISNTGTTAAATAAAPAAPAATSSTWKCEACTSQNDDSAKQCNVCTSPRPGAMKPQLPAAWGSFSAPPPQQQQQKAKEPVAAASSDAAGAGWKCPGCDKECDASEFSCIVCLATKPGSESAPILPSSTAPVTGEPWTCVSCSQQNDTVDRCARCFLSKPTEEQVLEAKKKADEEAKAAAAAMKEAESDRLAAGAASGKRVSQQTPKSSVLPPASSPFVSQSGTPLSTALSRSGADTSFWSKVGKDSTEQATPFDSAKRPQNVVESQPPRAAKRFRHVQRGESMMSPPLSQTLKLAEKKSSSLSSNVTLSSSSGSGITLRRSGPSSLKPAAMSSTDEASVAGAKRTRADENKAENVASGVTQNGSDNAKRPKKSFTVSDYPDLQNLPTVEQRVHYVEDVRRLQRIVKAMLNDERKIITKEARTWHPNNAPLIEYISKKRNVLDDYSRFLKVLDPGTLSKPINVAAAHAIQAKDFVTLLDDYIKILSE